MSEHPETTAPTDDATVAGLDPAALDAFLQAALAEDHADADITTGALVSPSREATADLIVKAPGVVCGLAIAARVLALVDPTLRVEALAEDGDTIGAGTPILEVTGRAGSILRAERTLLNVLQRLSGVATLTAEFVEATMATGAGIYDTRKTTPGWRALEKYAVRCGGGHNHRMDLSDAAMVKENHLRAAYGTTGPEAITKAVRALLGDVPDPLVIYVEAENQAELEAAAAAAGAQSARVVVMLDDFDVGDIRRAVNWLRAQPPPHVVLEITGGVTLDRVEGLAATGVRRLSTGALTHSAPALDMSLKIRPTTTA